jgi:hypothetical protein
LDLELTGDDRLEGLVAFGLVVLDRGAAVASLLPADTTGAELARAPNRGASLVIVSARLCGHPVTRDEDLSGAFAQLHGVEPTGDKIKLGRLDALG